MQVLDFVSDKDRASLDGLEIKGTVLVPEGFQLAGNAVLKADILDETFDRTDGLRHRPIPFQPVTNTVVGKLRTIADRCPINVRVSKRSIRGNNEFDNHGKAV